MKTSDIEEYSSDSDYGEFSSDFIKDYEKECEITLKKN